MKLYSHSNYGLNAKTHLKHNAKTVSEWPKVPLVLSDERWKMEDGCRGNSSRINK